MRLTSLDDPERLADSLYAADDDIDEDLLVSHEKRLSGKLAQPHAPREAVARTGSEG